jgi:nucleotide-binding universal stress UspA family protein
MKSADIHTHIQLRNILFATDFSHAANATAPYVASLAKGFGAKLYALHVRPPIINPMTPPESWPELEAAAEVVAERQRHQLLGTFAGIQLEVLIKEGDLWSNLRDAVEENKIDLIVIGTRGRSGISKFLLGSSAEEILREASCPVLTIGPHCQARSKPSGQFTRILMAADSSPDSAAAARYAISLAEEFQAHLILLHVIEEPKRGDQVRPGDLAESSTNLLRSLIPVGAELQFVPDYVVERGVTADKILEIAATHEADLIVLGVRRATGFPGAATHLPTSIAHRIVSHATCPVLTARG